MKRIAYCIWIVMIAITAFAQQTKSAAGSQSDTKQAGPSKIDPKLEVQIWLDRKNFSPGEIDGTIGKNTQKALIAFQESRKLATTNPSDTDTLQALREEGVEPIINYTITEADVKGPFNQKIPEDFMDQATIGSFVGSYDGYCRMIYDTPVRN